MLDNAFDLIEVHSMLAFVNNLCTVLVDNPTFTEREGLQRLFELAHELACFAAVDGAVVETKAVVLH